MSNFFERYASIPPASASASAPPEPEPEPFDHRLSLGHTSQSTIASDLPRQQYPRHERQRQYQEQQQLQHYASLPSIDPPNDPYSSSTLAPPGRSNLAAIRKDSLLGSLSLGAADSEHSVSSGKDFELFPDIIEHNTSNNNLNLNNQDTSTHEEGDEFSSDFC